MFRLKGTIAKNQILQLFLIFLAHLLRMSLSGFVKVNNIGLLLGTYDPFTVTSLNPRGFEGGLEQTGYCWSLYFDLKPEVMMTSKPSTRSNLGSNSGYTGPGRT